MTKITMGALVHDSEEESMNKITQKMRKMVYIYIYIHTRKPGGREMRRTSFRRVKGITLSSIRPSLYMLHRHLGCTIIITIIATNGRIAKTTITLLNRDVSRLLEIHSGRFTRGRLNERTVPSANRDDS